MLEGKTLLTQAGHDKLREELDNLKVNSRKEVAGKIKEARAQGDLSENAEYDAALDEQRDIEARIEEIEALLKNSEIIADQPDDGSISIGSRVTIREEGTVDDITFNIVGSSEANSLKGLISNESPVGSALLGHYAGDMVKVEAPGGEIIYNVCKVERAET